jgi:hypothetical protein
MIIKITLDYDSFMITYSSGIVHFRMHFVIADQKRSAGGTLGNTALDEPTFQHYILST